MSRINNKWDDNTQLLIRALTTTTQSLKEPLQELEGGGGGDAIGTTEDTSDEYRVGESVTPYAGTGLITISDAGRVGCDHENVSFSRAWMCRTPFECPYVLFWIADSVFEL